MAPYRSSSALKISGRGRARDGCGDGGGDLCVSSAARRRDVEAATAEMHAVRAGSRKHDGRGGEVGSRRARPPRPRRQARATARPQCGGVSIGFVCRLSSCRPAGSDSIVHRVVSSRPPASEAQPQPQLQPSGAHRQRYRKVPTKSKTQKPRRKGSLGAPWV